MVVDIEELFKKYIEHVGIMEGVDFIPKGIQTEGIYHPFTHDELLVLWEYTGWNEKEGRYEK